VLFKDGDIVEHGEAAEAAAGGEEPGEAGDEQPLAASGSLSIGSLRGKGL
jgi:hypothetical protein